MVYFLWYMAWLQESKINFFFPPKGFQYDIQVIQMPKELILSMETEKSLMLLKQTWHIHCWRGGGGIYYIASMEEGEIIEYKIEWTL